MGNIILEFDKRQISIEEMKEHLMYYLTYANKAMELCSNNNNKDARIIYNKLKGKLKIENNYYEKHIVQNAIDKDNNYKYYFEAIHEAYVKQMNPNSNKTMFSNLYDIEDYIRYWIRHCDLKDVLD